MKITASLKIILMPPGVSLMFHSPACYLYHMFTVQRHSFCIRGIVAIGCFYWQIFLSPSVIDHLLLLVS